MSAVDPADSVAIAAPAQAQSAMPGARDRHRGRLFRKYLLLILSLVSAALLVSGGISLYFSYRETSRALAGLQQEKAIGAASRIEQYLRQVTQQLQYAALLQMGPGELELRRFEFVKLIRQAPEVTDISLIDADGRELIAESRLGMSVLASGKDRSAEPVFQQARRGQPWFGPVYFRKETEPYMTVAIRSGGEKPLLTVAELNLKFIWDVVSRIRIGDKGKAYVVDKNGFLVADPDIGLVLRKSSLAALAHVQAASAPGAAADEPAMVSHDLAGTRVLVSSAPIEPLEWKVFAEQPVAEVFARLNTSILWTGVLLLAGLAVSALAASALARSMVRPIRTLDEGARRIGAGDLERRIVVETGDELEGLAEQFNRMTAQLRESYAGLERKVERRTAELREALDYQTAISEVLRVISRSPADVGPVFEAIMQSARRLLGASAAAVGRYDGRLAYLLASHGMNDETLAFLKRIYPGPPLPTIPAGRAVLTGQVQVVPDTHVDPGYDAVRAIGTGQLGAWRRVLVVPMLKDGAAIGAISLSWSEPGEVPQRHIDLLKTFADQAVIATENARLINETREALDHQTAISEVLRVISQSPADVTPVFAAIMESARRLIGTATAAVFRYDGRQVHLVATHGWSDAALDDAKRLYPAPPNPAMISGRAILQRRVQQIADVHADPDYDPKTALLGAWRRLIAAPMLKDGAPVGAIAVSWPEGGETPPRQVELLKTFADQAVIAIENARLINETREALERQTATAEILSVISSSPTDVQPVLDAVAERSGLLCRAQGARVWLPEGGQLRAMTGYGGAYAALGASEVLPIDGASVGAKAFRERRSVHVEDVLAVLEAEYPDVRELQARYGFRTVLGVPMLREGSSVGVISLLRNDVRPFAESEIALVQTFADQAVIAIRNVQLFNETKEALERQTATSDILRVISESPTDVQPVLDAVAERATMLCDSMNAAVLLLEGQVLRTRANFARDPVYREQPKATVELRRTFVNGRAFLDRQTVHVEDIVPLLDTEYPDARESQQRVGFRAMLAVPLLREGQAIGTIFAWRREPRAFAPEQVALLQTFADQAVIALQNVRLFNETKEALEKQTATAEILRVISGSPTSTQPVFEAIGERSMRLCGADYAYVFTFDGEWIRLGVAKGVSKEGTEAIAAHFPARPGSGSLTARTVATGEVVRVADVLADPDYPLAAAARVADLRSVLGVPMKRSGQVVGAIMVARATAGLFGEHEVDLLQTFADQAVIAIENVRLFNETREALEQQTATAEVLQVISSSVADAQPVFDKILRSCEHLFAGDEVGILLAGDDGQLHFGAQGGAHPYHGMREGLPAPLEGSATALAIQERRVLHYVDVLSDPAVPPVARRLALGRGFDYTLALAPMLWEGRGVGSIFVTHAPPGAFSAKDLELLKTFAGQAVIAIQNARLFREIQDKSRQLEIANQHKSEFLANMSHELRTPLNAIIGFSEVLIERMFGELNDKQDDYLKDIHTSGKHLLSLINDILDLSKIEAGRMELDIDAFDVPAAIGNALTLVRERAQRHGIALGQEVAAEVGEIRADERKFKQILLNLLTNAVKFTPDGGRVDVRAALRDGVLAVAVADTGIGIAPEDQAAVFEEFRQVGRHYTNKQEGTGLGLALTKRFVELHGGTLTLVSAPGRGSTFTFTLPSQP